MKRPMMACCLTLVAAAGAWAAAPGRAAAPKVGEPTLITLHYNNAPAEAVFKDLGVQMGREYVASGGDILSGWPQVTIDADKEPYWEVMAKLDDAIGFSANVRRNGKVNVSRTARRNGVRCISGPVMILATNVRHDAIFTSPDISDNCVITCALNFEPNMEVAAFSGRIRPEVAVDEKGNSLMPAALKAPTSPTGGVAPLGLRGGAPGVQGVEAELKGVRADTENSCQIVLAPPANAGYRIARVKGNVILKIIDKATVLEIPTAEFSQQHTVSFQGANISIGAITNTTSAGARGPQPYRVSLNMNRGGMGEDEWTAVNQLFDMAEVTIVDDKGLTYVNSGGGWGGGNTSRSISFSLGQNSGIGAADDNAGPAAKCRIMLPEVLKDVLIPFEFKDLPLP
jgi:hypothetical protein